MVVPDKQLSTVSYAAGASLAAIALVYVFAPNFAIDESETSSSRKKGVVGLVNYANDCFINATLQALAGLGDLRIYLIRETHRRNIEDPAVYTHLIQPPDRKLPEWKVEGLQKGAVTRGLKDMLDTLNERPIYKKSSSAMEFVKVLETAFRQRVSRQQQDAQEFLQIVAERLKDEYHAGERARLHAQGAASTNTASESSQPEQPQADAGPGPVPAPEAEQADADVAQQEDAQAPRAPAESDHSASATTSGSNSTSNLAVPSIQTNGTNDTDNTRATSVRESDVEQGFPMEGQHESYLECQTCGYKTKPRHESFVMLTLNVPRVSSTSLSSCFDEIFKTEYIDDFKCEKCRLIHAEELLRKDLARSKSEEAKAKIGEELERLRDCIETDPEKPPSDMKLPDLSRAPKRRIARSSRISTFPKILAIHLSRSIFDTQTSMKNSAKVSFPERLPLGGLADRRNYKLLALVSHRGSHNSGHYESFRRQPRGRAPYPNINTFQPSEVYSRSASPAPTPRLQSTSRNESPRTSTPELLPQSSSATTTTTTNNSSTPSLDSQLASDAPHPSPRSPSHSHSHTHSRSRSLRHKLSPTSAPGPDAASTPPRNSRDAETSSIRSVANSTRSALSKITLSRDRDRNDSGSSITGFSPPEAGFGQTSSKGTTTTATMTTSASTGSSVPFSLSSKPGRRKKNVPDRWWRISDEKVKEAKTGEVLGMQREVYILFYELERDDEGETQ